MRQAWRRDTPRGVSNPLPIPSSSSSSNEESTDFMFAMSFSESYDDESDLSPHSDQLGHTLHPDALFHRARQQSARGGMGSARDGSAMYHSSRKRPQAVQSLYSFPEPSTLTNGDPSTSPDSPISARWPSHSSSFKHGTASGATHFRRYNPISQASADYHHRLAPKHSTAYSSTDGDEDGEEDEDEDDFEYSSDINKPPSSRPEALSSQLNRGNYPPFHVPSTRVDLESAFKNDHHPGDLKPVLSGYSHVQHAKANDTPRQNDSYAATHRNNHFGAHTFQPLNQDHSTDAKQSKHFRHRSTHDIISYTPRVDSHAIQQQQQQQQQQKLAVPTTTTRPRSNTGGNGGYRLSTPRHPLMSKTTATSYVANPTLVPSGLASYKNDSHNVATSFANLKIN